MTESESIEQPWVNHGFGDMIPVIGQSLSVGTPTATPRIKAQRFAIGPDAEYAVLYRGTTPAQQSATTSVMAEHRFIVSTQRSDQP